MLTGMLPALFCVAVAQAQSSPDKDVFAVRDLQKLERTFAHLAETARPSVVAIETRQVLSDDGQRSMPNSQGSGFVLRSDGIIATNHHVVEGADRIIVTLFDGARHDAQIVEFDPRSDLAILKIDATNLRVAPMGDLSEVRVGQWCYTVGSPFGVANGNGKVSVSFGGVAAIGRSLTDYIQSPGNDRFYGNLIETDASINPGNSGGPLFDVEGRVIGVNTAMMSRSGVNEGMGYAVPMTERTRTILNTLADGQNVRYGFLGVRVQDADRRQAIETGVYTGKGAVIDALTGNAESSPAARAGLQPNDVITEFAGETIANRDDLIRVVGATPVGTDVHVVYYRDQRPQTATVQLDERIETVVARARGGSRDGLRTMVWRQALLVEPTEAFLLSRTNTRTKPGIFVAEVPRRSPLYRRGLREDQLIVAVNGARVRTLEELKQAEDKSESSLRLDLDDGSTVTIPKY
jgi:serine protease Do